MAQGVALITRSTGVSGRSTSLELANNGFDIALCDDPHQDVQSESRAALAGLQREIQAKGVRCETFVCDLLREESIKDLIDDVARVMGGVDVMFVNVFDLSTRFAPITDLQVEDWDRTFAVNTRPTFMCYKYAAAQMIKQGRGGRLIVRFTTPGIQAYPLTCISASCAAQYAMRGLSQTAALELGPHNITVNAVVHGYLDDSDEGPYGFKEALPGYEQMIQQLNPDRPIAIHGCRQLAADRTPLPKKIANGQEIARAVAFLASKECDFMTGQSIVVDGGEIMH